MLLSAARLHASLGDSAKRGFCRSAMVRHTLRIRRPSAAPKKAKTMRTVFGTLSTLAALSATASLGVLWQSQASAADEKQVCLGAYISAQRLRQDDKLVGARDQLLVCGRDVCPAGIKKDCSQWLAEVDQATPTIVVEARTPDGSDLVDVHVTIDGQPFLDRLDGKEKALDPGVHTFRFEMEGAPTVQEKVVVHSGEKVRRLKVTLGSGASKADSGAGPAPTSTGEGAASSTGTEAGGDRPVPTLVYVFGGLGLVAAGTFTYFALKFDSQVSDLEKCKQAGCSQSQVDDASSTRTLSFIPLGVGVVSLGLATYFYLSRPTVNAEPAAPASARGPHFDFRQINGGGMATFGAQF